MNLAIKFLILLLMSLKYFECTEGSEGGLFTLLPSNNTYVCFGEEVTLRCETSERYLRWNISIPHNGYKGSRLISYGGSSTFKPLTLNNTILSFSRLSTSPLIATLMINNVTIDMTIFCMELSVSVANSLTTDIHVITTRGFLNAPNIVISEQLFGLYNFTIILEMHMPTWNASYEALYNISFSIAPDPIADSSIVSTNGSYVQLTLLYNTYYNVNAAATLCSESSDPTTTELFYVACASLPQTAVNSSIIINGLPTSTAEGTNVTFTCPSGLVLSGPNISTCMGNGEWKPDPWELECKVDCALPRNNNISLSFNSTLDGSALAFRCVTGLMPGDEQTAVCHKNGSWVPDPAQYVCFIPANCGPVPSPPSGYVSPYSNTLEGATVTFMYTCKNNGQSLSIINTSVCSQDGNWDPNPANICGKSLGISPTAQKLNHETIITIILSMSVFIAGSAIFVILGFACGYCYNQKCYTSETQNVTLASEFGITDSTIEDLELKENAAYGTVHSALHAQQLTTHQL